MRTLFCSLLFISATAVSDTAHHSLAYCSGKQWVHVYNSTVQKSDFLINCLDGFVFCTMTCDEIVKSREWHNSVHFNSITFKFNPKILYWSQREQKYCYRSYLSKVLQSYCRCWGLWMGRISRTCLYYWHSEEASDWRYVFIMKQFNADYAHTIFLTLWKSLLCTIISRHSTVVPRTEPGFFIRMFGLLCSQLWCFVPNRWCQARLTSLLYPAKHTDG